MKAKLFVCDSDVSYKLIHRIYTNKSYAECYAFDVIIDDVEVDCSCPLFNELALLYHYADEHRPADFLISQKICGWQNFILKFENDEVVELHRPLVGDCSQTVLDRRDDCAANWDAIRRFKEDVANAIAGKSEIVFSEDEDFVV